MFIRLYFAKGIVLVVKFIEKRPAVTKQTGRREDVKSQKTRQPALTH